MPVDGRGSNVAIVGRFEGVSVDDRGSNVAVAVGCMEGFNEDSSAETSCTKIYTSSSRGTRSHKSRFANISSIRGLFYSRNMGYVDYRIKIWCIEDLLYDVGELQILHQNIQFPKPATQYGTCTSVK